MTATTKKCSKCQETKPLSEFYADKRTKCGACSPCKKCMLAFQKAKRDTNIEKVRAKEAKYRKKNRKRITANNKRYMDANRELIRERNRNWGRNNLGMKRIYCRNRRALKNKIKEKYTLNQETITRQCFNHQCFNCGSKENLSIDHNYPLCKKNKLALRNAVVLCKPCNSIKHDKLPTDFYGEQRAQYLQVKLELIQGIVALYRLSYIVYGQWEYQSRLA